MAVAARGFFRNAFAGTRGIVMVGVVLGASHAMAAPPGPLGGQCVMMSGAGRAACRPSLQTSLQPRARGEFGYADFAGAYSIYRLVSATDEQRRCRLQPTCSLFAARAARRFGLLRGLLMGLARAQMAHSDQDGVLPRALASDGKFIYLDPVERWVHGDR